MSYTILDRQEVINMSNDIFDEEGNLLMSSREEKTVMTLVEYDFNGTVVTVNIPHFMPQSEDDIILGITNREVTEFEKLSQSAITE